jgi:hypothetical protein
MPATAIAATGESWVFAALRHLPDAPAQADPAPRCLGSLSALRNAIQAGKRASARTALLAEAARTADPSRAAALRRQAADVAALGFRTGTLTRALQAGDEALMRGVRDRQGMAVVSERIAFAYDRHAHDAFTAYASGAANGTIPPGDHAAAEARLLAAGMQSFARQIDWNYATAHRAVTACPVAGRAAFDAQRARLPPPSRCPAAAELMLMAAAYIAAAGILETAGRHRTGAAAAA